MPKKTPVNRPQRKRDKKKHIRQSLERRNRNRSRMSKIRTSIKKLDASMSSGDRLQSEELLKETNKLLDKAASKNLIHSNRAANKKSRLVKKFNDVFPS